MLAGLRKANVERMEGLPPRVLSVNGDVAEKAAHGHGRSAAFKRTTEHTAQRRRQAGSTQTRPPSSLSSVLIKYQLLSQSLLIQPSAAPPDLYSSLCLGTIKCSSHTFIYTHTHTHHAFVSFYTTFILPSFAHSLGSKWCIQATS